jgi:hypothetical protein
MNYNEVECRHFPLFLLYLILFKAKLLLATYNDETVNVDMDVNISNYKQAVDACHKWEKSSVCLAQYYDRVLGVMAEEERNTRGG